MHLDRAMKCLIFGCRSTKWIKFYVLPLICVHGSHLYRIGNELREVIRDGWTILNVKGSLNPTTWASRSRYKAIFESKQTNKIKSFYVDRVFFIRGNILTCYRFNWSVLLFDLQVTWIKLDVIATSISKLPLGNRMSIRQD